MTLNFIMSMAQIGEKGGGGEDISSDEDEGQQKEDDDDDDDGPGKPHLLRSGYAFDIGHT